VPTVAKESKSNHIQIKFPELLNNYDITMSAAMISKTALLSSEEYFDSRLNQAEEFDLFARICITYDAIKLVEPLVVYRLHPNQLSRCNYNLLTLELHYIINKISLMNKTFFENNQDAINQFSVKLALHDFINYCVYRGDSRTGRAKLLQYKYNSFKYFSLYYISFLGSKVIKILWEYTRNRFGRINPVK